MTEANLAQASQRSTDEERHELLREAAVTARVTTLKGPGRYYLDGDEPPGQWLGRGVATLGLAGRASSL